MKFRILLLSVFIFFLVNSTHAQTILSVSPSTLIVGAPSLVQIKGSGFASSNTVTWNGFKRSATFVSSTLVVVQPLLSDVDVVGIASVRVCKNGSCKVVSNAIGVQIVEKLVILTSSLPPVTSGVYYAFQLQAAGGTQPYHWAITSGSLPPGMTLSGDGWITGTTTLTGVWPFKAGSLFAMVVRPKN